MDNLMIASPEIFLLTATCVVLVVGLFLKPEQRYINYWMAQATLVVTLIIASGQVGDAASTAFSGAYGLDTMSAALKCVRPVWCCRYDDHGVGGQYVNRLLGP